MHYQRAATATGELVIDGQAIAIAGHAFRDRTWGYRDESASVAEYFGCMLILPSMAITSMKLRGASSSAEMVLGNVLEDEATIIQSASLTRDASGLFAATSIETADGRTLEFRIVERRAGFWCPMGVERTGPTLSAFDEVFTQPSSALQFQFPSDALFTTTGDLLTANLGPTYPVDFGGPGTSGSITEFNPDGTFNQVLTANSFPADTTTGVTNFSPSQFAINTDIVAFASSRSANT